MWDRPWQRKFLGYTVCGRKYNIRLLVAPTALMRLRGDLKAVFRRRGRALGRVIEDLWVLMRSEYGTVL